MLGEGLSPEASIQPPLKIRPHHLLPSHPTHLGGRGGEVDGSTFQDLLGNVWDLKVGMAIIGDLPVGGRLSLFLPAGSG